VSTDVWDNDEGLSLTRYCGPGTTPGPHRLRWQLTFAGAYQAYERADLAQLADDLESLASSIRAEIDQ